MRYIYGERSYKSPLTLPYKQWDFLPFRTIWLQHKLKTFFKKQNKTGILSAKIDRPTQTVLQFGP